MLTLFATPKALMGHNSARHVPDVVRNEQGASMVNEMVEQATKNWQAANCRAN